MDHWVYLGTEDPYCYIEVAYDTWWLQATHMKQHCLEEFKKLNCMFVGNEKVESKIEFLEVKTVEYCTGIRGTRQSLTHGVHGWHRVHMFEPTYPTDKLVTIHGPLLAVIEKNNVVQITRHYLALGLWYDGKRFKNVNLQHGSRKWIKPHWLIVQKVSTLAQLVKGVIWLRDHGETTQEIPEKDFVTPKCTTLITDGKDEIVFGDRYKTTPSGLAGQMMLSCGPKPCRCHEVHKEALEDLTPEKAVFLDEEEGVFGKLLSGLKKIVLDIFNRILGALFGNNWTTKVIVAGLTYYITSQVTKSVGAGIAMALVIVWNAFLNA